MFVIAGLGNPMSKYKGTRHNVGFDVIDMLADRYHIRVKDKKFQALCGSGVIEGQKALLVKPQTFMNLSGESIGAVINFYKLEAKSELIVVYDDVSLEPGRLRIRKKGSAVGHNGVKNIISHLKTEEFQRVKIGVGQKPEGWDLADYVLRCPPRKERILLEEAFDNACEAISLMVQGKTEQAMNRFN